MKNNTSTFGARIKDSIRKKVVGLKRNPQIIPMLVLVAAFLVYSLNLTDISNTTAKINRAGMGICQFAMMLLTLLSMVCLLNAFPRRKKANLPMIILMFVMFGIVIFCANNYRNEIVYACHPAYVKNPLNFNDPSMPYIKEAYDMLMVYMILVGVSAGLVATLPLYSKLLKKINTGVVVEDNGDMAEIEITEE